MSFQITISPSRKAAAAFVTAVRRAILKAYIEEQENSGLTQSAIAKTLGVHRSVINRELRGLKDITLGRVAELAWAMGRIPAFDLPKRTVPIGSNIAPVATVPAQPRTTQGTVFIAPSKVQAATTTANG